MAPKVQIYGDIGILTLRYHTHTTDGKPLTRVEGYVCIPKNRGGVAHRSRTLVHRQGIVRPRLLQATRTS